MQSVFFCFLVSFIYVASLYVVVPASIRKLPRDNITHVMLVADRRNIFLVLIILDEISHASCWFWDLIEPCFVLLLS
jgi:hypothetical protein